MKRVLICLLILSLFSLVAAQDSSIDPDVKDDVTGKAEDLVGGIQDTAGSLDEATEDVLEQEVNIPKNLEIFTKILIGVKSRMTWQQIIMIVGIWLIFLLILTNIISISSSFSQVTSVVISLGLNIIFAMTGFFSVVGSFFISMWDVFGWVEKIGAFAIFLYLFVLLIIFLIASYVFRKIKNKVKIKKAKDLGETIGARIEKTKTFEEKVDEINKELKK